MSRLSDGAYGPRGTKLGELTDEELREERARRWGDDGGSEAPPPLHRVRQYLANLELGANASWPDVERAYNRLRERYSPERHADHPERHRTAVELSESLNAAYQALRRYFER